MYLLGQRVVARIFQGYPPVNASLPGRVKETHEHEQKHGPNKQLPTVSPVDTNIRRILGLDNLARHLLRLPGVAAAPDDKGKDRQGDEAGLGADGAAGLAKVEGISENDGADNLAGPIHRV